MLRMLRSGLTTVPLMYLMVISAEAADGLVYGDFTWAQCQKVYSYINSNHGSRVIKTTDVEINWAMNLQHQVRYENRRDCQSLPASLYHLSRFTDDSVITGNPDRQTETKTVGAAQPKLNPAPKTVTNAGKAQNSPIRKPSAKTSARNIPIYAQTEMGHVVDAGMSCALVLSEDISGFKSELGRLQAAIESGQISESDGLRQLDRLDITMKKTEIALLAVKNVIKSSRYTSQFTPEQIDSAFSRHMIAHSLGSENGPPAETCRELEFLKGE